ncbi:MAG: asparaginase domain-containing protein [Betaproteobacteria bacterium]|nr:asparaginase domain-containing protein [Betaproteobacteria bacterium]
MSAPILVLTCGGTFDKNRFTKDGKFVCGSTEVERILADTGVAAVECEEIMRKDSLDMDDEDRSKVAATVAGAASKRIVIVHGTDTMEATARALAVKNFAKTVVLTGAMRPAVFAHTDADFNLGFALGCAAVLGTGVWVAMHGEIFPAAEVTKDVDQMRFVRKA